MKPWQKRLVTTSFGGGILLAGSALRAYRYAMTGDVWNGADFWLYLRPGLILTVVVVLFLAFSRYE